MQEKGIADTLFRLCSVELDRRSNDKQVNVEIMLETTREQRKMLKESFDRNSKAFGFTINYTNLFGNP